MKRKILTALGAAGCIFLPAVPVAAATKSPIEASRDKQTMRRASHSVAISGKITMVDLTKQVTG